MKRRRVPIALGLLLVAAFVVFKFYPIELVTNIAESFDEFLYDNALKMELGQEKPLKDMSIIVVDIDESSIKEIGHWPWPRDKVAQLVDGIRALGAISVALDVFFSDSPPNPVDEVLAKATGSLALDGKALSVMKGLKPQLDRDEILKKSLGNGDVSMAFLLHDDENQSSLGALPQPLAEVKNAEATNLFVLSRYQGNLALLQEAAGNGGFITVIPDRDGVIRKAPLILAFNDTAYPSLSLEAVRVALLLERKEVKLQWGMIGETPSLDGIKVGADFNIPTDPDGRVLIPFRGARSKFKHIAAADIINGKVKSDALKNAIVFVGSSALSLSDFISTPIGPQFPGVDAHASMAEGILTQNFVYAPYFAPALELALLVVFGLVLAFLLPFLEALWMVLAALIAMVLLIGSYAGLFHFNNMLISVSLPLGLVTAEIAFNLVYGMLFEFRRRAQLKNLFGQYVPKELVERMSEHPELYSMEGSSEVLSVLFADVMHFTTICEGLTPKQIRDMLNRYFTPMTRIILENKGTIDKYVGDMIMAFWGAPISDPDHAKNALTTALQMQAETQRLTIEFAQLGLPEIHIGIGVNTGTMSVGDMGSEYRRAYTVLGDTVNTGSRMEGLTRFYGIKIATGQDTRTGQEDFVFRLVDKVKVKGKAKAVELYEVVGFRKDATPELIERIGLHEKGMQLYFAKDFKAAAAIFQSLLSDNKIMYELYLDRIKMFETSPPPDDWDGATEWTKK